MEQKTPDVLRAEFWEKDIAGGGIIYNQYSEIKRVLQTRDMDWVRARYEDLRRHAIAHTEFYKNYSMEDEFPVVNKLSLLADKERHTARDGFQHPIHISSTSGSTGTPFSVVQDYKKRNRTIADLKVFGELCDYPSHERMVFFRVLSEKLKRSPEQERRENIFYIDSSDLGDAHLNEMYRTIVEKQPRIVFSYQSPQLLQIPGRIVADGNMHGRTSCP